MEQAKILLSLQEDKIEQIQKAQTNYFKTPKSRITVSYVETRLETLERLYCSFTKGHEELSALILRSERSSVDYFSLDKFEELDELYTTYKTSLKEKLIELTISYTPSPSRTSLNTDIKLPAIQIPTFSGNYTDWPSFRDLYTSIIHKNTTLDDVQKLHYLKSLVSGEAEQLLRSIRITNDNYALAWDTLHKRFENKRYIANDIFKKLFSLKTISKESAQLLKQMMYTTLECLNSLKNIGINTESWDDILVYMTVSKLDPTSHRLWEQHISGESDNMPSFQQLCRFLEMRFKSLEMVEDHTSTSKSKSFHSTASASPAQCSFCDGDHYIFQCKLFVRLSHDKRTGFVKENNLCFNCLIPNHSATECLRDTCCNICRRKHHSLLHPGRKETPENTETHYQETENISTHFIQQPGQVLLATALVDVSEETGKTHIYRALLDQGSQASFVTEDLVKSAGLKRTKLSGEITGLSEGSKLRTQYVVEFKIRSRIKPHFTVPVQAYVLKSITNYLPPQECTVTDWPQLKTIALADPTFTKPKNIDILLGADVYAKIVDNGLLRSSTGTIAQKTKLGWVILGAADTTLGDSNPIVNLHICNLKFSPLRKLQQTSVIDRNQGKHKLQCGRTRINTPWWAVKNGVLGGRNVDAVSAAL